MNKFIIRVNELSFEGIFPSGFDAVIHYMEQFPEARRISARRLP